MRPGGLALAVCVVAALLAAPAARADLGQLKAACTARDASPDPATPMPYRFCDDGVPPTGGTSPNPTVDRAVAVPAAYQGVVGLPPAATDARNVAGADPLGRIALDVDVSLPDPARHPRPASGWPVVVLMHGCCGGNKTGWERTSIEPGDAEGWHYNNAWFASRGYVAVTYTARGFVSSDADGQRGSTGQTQIDDARFEINDYQHLVGQLVDDDFFGIDPSRVVVTGGSYGGGFSWLALTDPVWRSPGGREVRVAAVAPKYGWTDLVYSLVPNGHQRRDALPAFDGRTTASPLGFPKQSIVAGLYASGRTGVPPGTGSHATFPPDIDQGISCLSSSDPFETNPLCTETLRTLLPEFLRYRSAYYQDHFWTGLAAGTIDPVPVFSAGAFTDPLFTSAEHRRMADRLRATRGDYPIQEYYGDYQHFTANKAREWGDVCGADRHVCRLADYPGRDPDADPASLVRRGATTRLNRFLDHYARPQGNPSESQPGRDVVAALQVCEETARMFGVAPADGGPQFTAPTFAGLTRGSLRIEAPGVQSTGNSVAPNPHAARADPIFNERTDADRCVNESAPDGSAGGGPGVATYDSVPLAADVTMIGRPRVTAVHAGSGSGVQLNARLYDLDPVAGRQVLVDRGPFRVAQPVGTSTWDLHGNAWRFAQGHRIRVELTQDDSPYMKASSQSSALTLSRVHLELPTREPSLILAGGLALFPQRARVLAPRVSSDASPSRRFTVRAAPRGRRSRDLAHFQVQVRRSSQGLYRWLRRRLPAGRRGRPAVRFTGLPGRTYWFRVRAVSRAGYPGRWAYASVVVPFDDGAAAWSRGWTRPRARRAFLGRTRRATRRGARVALRFSGRNRFYVVGRRGPGGGVAAVYVDGRRVGTLRARARRTRPRAVLFSRAVSRGRHRLSLVVRSGRVEIDGFGLRTPTVRVGR